MAWASTSTHLSARARTCRTFRQRRSTGSTLTGIALHLALATTRPTSTSPISSASRFSVRLVLRVQTSGQRDRLRFWTWATLKVKAGWEYGVTHGQSDGDLSHTRQNGVGGAVQFVINPYIEGGVNGAIGYLDYWIDTGLPKPENSTTTKSYGGFLNGRVYGPLMLGFGANQTLWNNLKPNANALTPNLNGRTDSSTHFQGFGAIQYSFWDKLFFKFVANYARFHYEDVLQAPYPHPYTNNEWGGRLRMMYLF